MANYIYGAVALTGGGTGSLDSLNGADLAAADAAIVFTPTATYIYTLVDGIAKPEDSPEVIVPDINYGNKVWQLVSSRAAESSLDNELFNGILDSSHDDVQKALSSIDDMFDAGDFQIAPGSVQLSNLVIKQLNGDTGFGLSEDHTLNILGSGKVKTLGNASNITISVDDLKIATKTSNYTILPADDIIVADCSGGNVQLTLPQASLKSAITVVKKSNSNLLQVYGYGTETIEGSQSITIEDEYGTLRLISDGTNTWIKSGQMFNLPVASEYTLGAIKVGENLTASNGVLTTDFSAFNQDIVPDVDIIRSLGSETKAWKDVFIGPGSLYVNGQKVIEESAGTIVLSADVDQNVQIKTAGGGDIEFYPSGSGAIDMKGNLSIQGGKNFLSGDGNPINVTVGFNMNGENITGLATPVNPGDATTMAFTSNASNITSGTLPLAQLPGTFLEISDVTAAVTTLGLQNVINIDCTNASNITTGTLPSSVLPPIAITSTQVAVSQIAMLALTTQQGDVVVRTDESKSYIRNAGLTGTMADFNELSTPVDAIQSVNSKTGSVILTQDDVGDGVTYKRTHNDLTSTLLTKLNEIETAATADQTAGEIKTAYESNADTNVLTDTLQNKLNGIESGATADQTNAEIKTAYENNLNTNAFTDTLQSKLNGIDTSLYTTKIGNLSDLTNATTARTNIGLGNVPNIDCTNAANITTGILPSSVLPPIAITKTQVAVSQVEMLALTTQEGDVVVRTDESKSYIHNGGSAGTMADFTLLSTPVDTIQSVNSQTGTVLLTQDNVGDGTTYKRTHNDLTSTLLAKLNGIETAATSDQTPAQIKIAYESNPDTHAFTDDDQTKLIGIETAATADQTAGEIKTAYESNANTNAFTDSLVSKLNGIEASADVNLTASELKTSYESNSNTNAFTDTLHGKLTDINTSLYTVKTSNLADLSSASTARSNIGLGNVPNVDCTNASNITTGTLPSSVLPPIAITTTQTAVSEIAMLALTTQEGDVVVRTDENKSYIKNAGVTGTMTDFTMLSTPVDAIQSVNSQTGTVVLTQDNVADGATYKRSTAVFTPTLLTKLNGIETAATANQTAGEIKTAYESNANTNAFTDALQIKLNGIEASADVNQTAGEIKIAYESNADTNAFTNALSTKLTGIESGATGDMSASEILGLVKSVDGSGSGLDADLLDGFSSNEGAVADTIVLRNSVGSINAAQFIGTHTASTHTTATRTTDDTFFSTTDNYIRKNSLTGFKTSLGLENVPNVAGASGNTADSLVLRDTNGDFAAGIITADLAGNASTATQLVTARTLSLAGDATGSVNFDGSANVEITVVVANNSHSHIWANVSDKPLTFEPTVLSVQDIVGAMVAGNTETGIAVTYQALDHTLDFVLTADPVITLTGDVTGTGTMTNLTSVSITTTVADDSHAHTLSTLPSIDEDTMVSNSDTLLPTQQSVKAYVDTKVAGVLDAAPAALDTLNELATALGNDPNFATSMTTTLGTKANNTVTITAGAGLTGGGTLAANRTISHADTSTQPSVTNAARTYIKDITLDTYGHITAIASATETIVDTDTWRGIDDIPVNGQTTESITSNWAYDHENLLLAHGATDLSTGSTIVARDANGDFFARYLKCSYVNMSSSVQVRNADTTFYSSTDGYIRKNTSAGFLSSLGLENVTNAAATSLNTANSIVRRDASGDFAAGLITATCTTALFADLAEKYTCKDTKLITGTVVSACIDGTFEVEECSNSAAHNVIGVVSEKAAYIMNSDLKNSVTVGLTGKVPVRVVGLVEKGKVIISAGNGCARQMSNNVELLYKIGIALESNDSEDEKLVYCAIK